MTGRPKMIEIVEVGPRDGLQNEKHVFSTQAKIELVRRAFASGVRRIEVTSFVNPARVPQMADAEAVIAGVEDLPGVRLSALALNDRGADRAIATSVQEVTFGVVASETFNVRNQGATVRETLNMWKTVSRRLADAGKFRSLVIGAAFGCPFEGEVTVEKVVEIAKEASDIGVEEIALADTIGVAVPRDIEIRFRAVADGVPGMPLRAHLHNTRNTGYANADAALRSGVTVLDSSAGGIGGCPFAPQATGNIATEDLIYMLQRSRVETGVNHALTIDTARWLEARMNRRVPAQSAHVSIFPPDDTPRSRLSQQAGIV